MRSFIKSKLKIKIKFIPHFNKNIKYYRKKYILLYNKKKKPFLLSIYFNNAKMKNINDYNNKM